MVIEHQLKPRIPLTGVDYADEAVADRWLAAEAWVSDTLGALFERAGRDRADSTVLVDDTGRLTYGELDTRSREVARLLHERGLQPGDRVLMQVGISTTAVIALAGVFRAGLIPVCTVAQYRMHEMHALAVESGARAYIVEPGAAGAFDLVGLARAVRDASPSLEHVIVAGASIDGTVPLEGSTAGGPTADFEVPQPSPFDVAVFQLSGGTTGVPKIIPRFHAEYLGYAEAWAARLDFQPDDVVLWCLPLTHNAGMLCFLLPVLLRGAKLVLQSRFDAEQFLQTIETERVTLTGSIGPITPRLLDHSRATDFDLSSMRLFVSLNRAGDIENHLGVASMNIYGITEGLLMASATDSPALARHGTVGSAVADHDEVRFLAPGTEDDVPVGSVGELCFRGPSVLRSYYRNPDATRAAFTSDGFFRTGDLVCAHDIDCRRYIAFEGRAKDNIDRGGEKFGVESIEAMLSSHPAIAAVAIVGMPDRYMGERACAFVIPRSGSAAPTVEDVGGFLLQRGLAKFKLPERIEPLDEMPVTSVGKLDRPELRRRIAETLRAEGNA